MVSVPTEIKLPPTTQLEDSHTMPGKDSSVYRGSLYDLSWVCDGGCSEDDMSHFTFFPWGCSERIGVCRSPAMTRPRLLVQRDNV